MNIFGIQMICSMKKGKVQNCENDTKLCNFRPPLGIYGMENIPISSIVIISLPKEDLVQKAPFNVNLGSYCNKNSKKKSVKKQ